MAGILSFLSFISAHQLTFGGGYKLWWLWHPLFTDTARNIPFLTVSLLVVFHNVDLKKNEQYENYELSFIWDKMRTAAWEIACQTALRNCSKEAMGKGQYTGDLGEGRVHARIFCTSLLWIMRRICHHEGFLMLFEIWGGTRIELTK